MQIRHEKARRQALGMEESSSIGNVLANITVNGAAATAASTGQPKTAMRRRITGEGMPLTSAGAPVGLRPGALSPLNPKARATSGLLGMAQPASGIPAQRPQSPQAKGKRTTTLAFSPKSGGS